MTTIVLSNAALRDLGEIETYSKGQWGLEQTIAYRKQIEGVLEHLMSYPQSGRRRNEIHVGLMSVAAGSHTVFYLHTNETIHIVRILHSRMDHAGRLRGF